MRTGLVSVTEARPPSRRFPAKAFKQKVADFTDCSLAYFLGGCQPKARGDCIFGRARELFGVYLQVIYLANISCGHCGNVLVDRSSRPVISPVSTPSGAPYSYDENRRPKSLILALRCVRCSVETAFERNGANTEVKPQSNPPTVYSGSVYVVREGF
jgi:ribosomal protein S27E